MGYEFSGINLTEVGAGARSGGSRGYSEERVDEFRRNFIENQRAAMVGSEDCWMTSNGQPVERFKGYDDLTVYAAFPPEAEEVADYLITLPHFNEGAVPMPAIGKLKIFKVLQAFKKNCIQRMEQ